jgi:multicomponent Na+:H+ antiporter subunit D
MSSLLQHPVLPFVLAAALVPWVGAQGRRLLSLAAPVAALALLLGLPDGARYAVHAAGHEWVLLRLDGLALPFASAFIVYAFIAGIYAWNEVPAGPKAASLGLAGAGVGVVLAGDLLSLFFFWEWLTVTSLFLIWYGNSPASWAAGFRYLIFHLAGAVALLVGILLQMAAGVTAFEALAPGDLSAWLILAGMLTNAAVPPLHAWLTDAYPRASIFGTVFLSAFTTKAAVYALARGFPGLEFLMWAGAVMALFGVTYVILENDIRRLLTYHIISQVGFMVAGVGIGSQLSLNGSVSHAFSHIFYKGLLMMSAGAVIHATGRGKLTDLGQLAGPLRWTMVFMLIGAFSISGAPLLNGFVSKSMTISAAAYAGHAPIELMLLVTSMGTFLSTALKLPWFTFYGPDNCARVQRPVPRSMFLAMALATAVCVVTGLFPGATLYRLLPFDAVYDPFTGHHFVESLQLLAGTALAFWLLRVKMASEPTVTWDIDRLYRQPLLWLVHAGGAAFIGLGTRVARVRDRTLAAAWATLTRYPEHRAPGTLSFQAVILIGTLAAVAYLVLLLHP